MNTHAATQDALRTGREAVQQAIADLIEQRYERYTKDPAGIAEIVAQLAQEIGPEFDYIALRAGLIGEFWQGIDAEDVAELMNREFRQMSKEQIVFWCAMDECAQRRASEEVEAQARKLFVVEAVA